MPDDATLVGEIVIRFYTNNHIEIDDLKGRQVEIGQIYRAGKTLAAVADLIQDIDRVMLDDDE